jgi:hypothetical protein
MNLNNTYRIELENKKESLLQYVEANSCDEAEAIVRNSFEAKLSGLDESYLWITSQRACKDTKLQDGKLQFHFETGWYSFNVNGLTIYEAMEQVQNKKFVKGETITEITN